VTIEPSQECAYTTSQTNLLSVLRASAFYNQSTETHMADAAVHAHDEHHKVGFFTRWFMSTNHKDIGILYLFTAALLGFVSVCFTVYMRLELMEPGVQYMLLDGEPNGHLWNVMITGHGILMMF